MYQNNSHTPEKERFDQIYATTYNQLFQFIKRMLPDKSGVKDAMQESYIRLWENLEEIRDDEKVLPLLRKYAINIIINALNKRKAELQRNHRYYADQPVSGDSEETLQTQQLMQKYQDALATLPPRRRKVFILKREQGLSHKQISDQLGISVFTIDRHMNEALRTLRKKLSADLLGLVLIMVDIQILLSLTA